VSALPFLFGKAPAHGDFIARGLSEDEERAWDGWATREMDTARERLGDRFDEAHDAAPPWGFVAREGAGWRAGALAASVDSAGRRFLLVMGYRALSAEAGAFLGQGAAHAAEGVLRRCILEQLGADAAVALLAELAPLPGDEAAAAALGAVAGADGVWWSLSGLVPPVISSEPPCGLVLSTLEQTADILGEAA
jgi:type VI secretion system protein ImpM